MEAKKKSWFNSNRNNHYHYSLLMPSLAIDYMGDAVCTRELLGDTQWQQRAPRLQSVCFLYLSVSSLLLSEHTVSHCAGLLVLSWNPKHPSWVAVDLGDCPWVWHWAVSWKYERQCELLQFYETVITQDIITIMYHHKYRLKEIPSK